MTPHGFSEDQLVEPALDSPLYTRRPDAVGFVNGLPLVVLELDKVKEAVVLDWRQKAQPRAQGPDRDRECTG